MPTDNQPAWKRLGDLLMRRRVEIDPRYRNRRVFVAERGMDYRMVNTVERGQRSNYEPQTIAAFEEAYQLAPGAIARTLNGADLEPLPPARSAREAAAPPSPLSDVDEAELRPYLQAVLDEIAAAIARHGPSPSGSEVFGNAQEAEIWDNSPWPRGERVRAIAVLRMLVDEALRPGRRRAILARTTARNVTKRLQSVILLLLPLVPALTQG